MLRQPRLAGTQYNITSREVQTHSLYVQQCFVYIHVHFVKKKYYFRQ